MMKNPKVLGSITPYDHPPAGLLITARKPFQHGDGKPSKTEVYNPKWRFNHPSITLTMVKWGNNKYSCYFSGFKAICRA
jgi:hypothetical protein